MRLATDMRASSYAGAEPGMNGVPTPLAVAGEFAVSVAGRSM
jgi:hypothetical protein